MSVQTCGSARPEAVMVEPREGGMASDVWLRRNIESDVADNGPDAEKAIEFWKADEVHFVMAGAPSVEEIQADFDALWDANDDGPTDAERIARLEQAVADANAALLEIGDLIGGE